MADVPARGSPSMRDRFSPLLRGKVCLFDIISGGCFVLLCFAQGEGTQCLTVRSKPLQAFQSSCLVS